MAKSSAWLKHLQEKQALQEKIHVEIQRRFALQQAQDIAVIAIHTAFGFGAERAKKFCAAYSAVFEEYAKMAITDGKDDADIEYTRGKVDELLKETLGDAFVPWDERYAWCFGK